MLRHLYTACALLTLYSCTTGNYADTPFSGSPQISYAEVKASPGSYNGQVITLGGKVLAARRLKEGTRIEILQLPLTSSLRPTMDLSKSQGRFVALQKEFLDPATVPPGTFVTVTGEMDGSVTLPLDEMEYSYPLVLINKLQMWTVGDEESPRMRPHFRIGPSWGLYWDSWPYYYY